MNVDAWLVDTVTVKAQSSTTGSYGDPSYGTASTLAARVQRGRDRSEPRIEHSAVIYTTTEIAPDSRVWLPGEDTADTAKARRPVKTYQTHDRWGSTTLYKTLLD